MTNNNAFFFNTALIFLCAFAGGVIADSATSVQKIPPQKYLEMIDAPAKIIKFMDPQSPILGMASKYETFPIVGKGTTWCRVLYKGDTGWVEIGKGKIVDSPTVISAKIPGIMMGVFIGGSLLLILAVGSIFVISSLKSHKVKRYAPKRDVLIISSSEKEIRYSLTETSTTLSKCLREIGFKVTAARDIDHARNLLIHYTPDVLAVNWQMERNIQPKVEAIISGMEKSSSLIVIFYNVPDPTEISRLNQSPYIYYVGLVFSDRDIFKIITPLIMSEKTVERSFKKSVQNSALEGEIDSGNLVEVMQFIEIGKKTGCLYISLKMPLGIIYFEQGRITYAAAPGSKGKNAINDILNLKEGHFNFVLDKVSSEKNLNCSTLEVLMEWTKSKDEADRA